MSPNCSHCDANTLPFGTILSQFLPFNFLSVYFPICPLYRPPSLHQLEDAWWMMNWKERCHGMINVWNLQWLKNITPGHSFFLCSTCYGSTATFRLIVQTCDEDGFFFVFPCNGAPVERNWRRKTEVLAEKTVPVPLCPPQIPHRLTRNRTRASAVRGRRLTAWAMARPGHS
jgi:hypothetical protein